MALKGQSNWPIVAVLAVLLLGGLLGWAWHDGGEVEMREMSAPAMLPGEGS